MGDLARACPEPGLAEKRAGGGAWLPARRIVPQAATLIAFVTMPGGPYPLVFRGNLRLRRQSLSAHCRATGSRPLATVSLKIARSRMPHMSLEEFAL